MDPAAMFALRTLLPPPGQPGAAPQRLGVPEERDITDPEFRQGLQITSTPTSLFNTRPFGHRATPDSLRVQQAILHGRMMGMIVVEGDDESATTSANVAIDNAVNPSLFVVREVERVRSQPKAHPPMTIWSKQGDINAPRADARKIKDTTMVLSVYIDRAFTFVKGYFCGFKMLCGNFARTESGVEMEEVNSGASLDGRTHTFEDIGTRNINYWKNTHVARFFDKDNMVMIHINGGVQVYFKNGLALELPSAIFPVIRVPTLAGQTVVYDVATGKPLPEAFQGWDGVETVKVHNMVPGAIV